VCSQCDPALSAQLCAEMKQVAQNDAMNVAWGAVERAVSDAINGRLCVAREAGGAMI